MNKDKLGLEPAFASSYDEFIGHDSLGNKIIERKNEIGMSKRFYAACAVMQGLCASNLINSSSFDFVTNSRHKVESIVKISFEFADELLRQENAD